MHAWACMCMRACMRMRACVYARVHVHVSSLTNINCLMAIERNAFGYLKIYIYDNTGLLTP